MSEQNDKMPDVIYVDPKFPQVNQPFSSNANQAYLRCDIDPTKAVLVAKSELDAWRTTRDNREALQERVAELEDERDVFREHYDTARAERLRLEAIVEKLPFGYASWEDWLASKYFIEIERVRGCEAWRLYVNGIIRKPLFSTYPAALEAAKEAVDDRA